MRFPRLDIFDHRPLRIASMQSLTGEASLDLGFFRNSPSGWGSFRAFLVEVVEVLAREAPHNSLDLRDGLPSLDDRWNELRPAKDWLSDFSTSNNLGFSDGDPDRSTERRNRVENKGGDKERG